MRMSGNARQQRHRDDNPISCPLGKVNKWAQVLHPYFEGDLQVAPSLSGPVRKEGDGMRALRRLANKAPKLREYPEYAVF